MADLDDFFAKKDKKKGKTKKFLSSEELVKQLELQSTVKSKTETKVDEELRKESSERILEVYMIKRSKSSNNQVLHVIF